MFNYVHYKVLNQALLRSIEVHMILSRHYLSLLYDSTILNSRHSFLKDKFHYEVNQLTETVYHSSLNY